MKSYRILQALLLASASTSAWCAPTNYVVDVRNGVIWDLPWAEAFSDGTFNNEVAFSAKPESKGIWFGSFKRMPKSAYKVTVTVRCSVQEILQLTGSGRGSLVEKGLFNLQAKVDQSNLPQIEACLRTKTSVTLAPETYYNTTDNQTQSYTWIIPSLKSGRHDFEFGAELFDQGTVMVSTAGTGIQYKVVPTISIEQVIIEPILLKSSELPY